MLISLIQNEKKKENRIRTVSKKIIDRNILELSIKSQNQSNLLSLTKPRQD